MHTFYFSAQESTLANRLSVSSATSARPCFTSFCNFLSTSLKKIVRHDGIRSENFVQQNQILCISYALMCVISNTDVYAHARACTHTHTSTHARTHAHTQTHTHTTIPGVSSRSMSPTRRGTGLGASTFLALGDWSSILTARKQQLDFNQKRLLQKRTVATTDESCFQHMCVPVTTTMESYYSKGSCYNKEQLL